MLTFVLVALHDAFELGHIWSHHVLHQRPKALALFWCELFQHNTRLETCFEVALMSRELHPRIFLFVFVRLKERRPLDDVAELSPADD